MDNPTRFGQTGLIAVWTLLTAAAPGLALDLGHDAADSAAVTTWIGQNLPRLEAMYMDLHAHPELSLEEQRTASILAAGLEAAGYAVSTAVGGHGVVGVLENGPGPTVLIRGDMDALPIVEDTGLPYASQVRVARPDGKTVGVMHACGHDIHTTALLGTAEVLVALRTTWSGSVVIVGQPAEEIGVGARAMLQDGLFERFPKPDFCIAQHVDAGLPCGTIGYVPGWAFANVDSVDVTLFGRPGHGARPNETVDPVVAAAFLVTQLQTLVSRRLRPSDPGVVTVGSIHAGSKHNIIPGEARLQLTVRSYSDEVRKQLLDGIRQMAEDTARSFQCPKAPIVTVRDEFTPASFNDLELSATGAALFEKLFGADRVLKREAEMIGEDFGQYSRVGGMPGFMFRVGTVSEQAYAESLKPGALVLPGLHSGQFKPLPGPTLETAIMALSNLALGLLD